MGKYITPNLQTIEDDLGSYFVYVFAGSSTDQDALDNDIINENANVVYDIDAYGNVENRFSVWSKNG